MQELKPRREMDPAFQWDLSPLFSSPAAWRDAYAETEKMIDALPRLAGTLGASAASLEAALSEIDRAAELCERVGVYAFLCKAGDNGDPDAQDMDDRATRLYVKLGSAVAFVDPEILSIDEKKLLDFLSDPALAPHRHYVEDVNRQRAHTLDGKGEEMLAALGEFAAVPGTAFDMLTNVDMEYPTLTDEAGREVRLSNGNFSVYRESRDRRVREEAFKGYFGAYHKFINTTAALYAGAVKAASFYSSARHYDGNCEAALFANNVPVSVYDSLIEAVHAGLPAMREYLDLRREVLGLDSIDVFDLYVPMVPDVDFKMPYENAKKLVREALAPLGEDYCRVLDRAFSERWIDVYENKGKESGAFSTGVFGVHPYVMLNYTDTLDDAFTLAHELGHAMHSYYSDTTQDFANHDYRIMVAEVASTVNEVLLAKHLLKTETDPKRRAYILNHFLEGFRTTVFRQTLFAEFERKAHDLYRGGTPLTAKTLSKIYLDLESEYYGGAKMQELIADEWSYIPHFYRPFYVYQYATGFSSAVAIADAIEKTGNAADYRRFLTLGGSDYPIEELKVAGIDLTSPETVKNAMKVFRETIREFADALGR
ncbi:MAG: oligoendopeptidase F [Clostridia bacterium]|nr:oligoendopeptidase F [Clostridia bacterium]MBP5429093.1 oligoendopeptidase F [Clostridia bacterium]